MYQYQITPLLLKRIKEITLLIQDLNGHRLSNPVVMNLKAEASSLSSFSSTSIEGNPLPLTVVKQILKTSPKQIRQSEREVLNYNKTLLWLSDEKEKWKLTKSLILKIHKSITQGLLPHFSSGKFRKKPVFVNDPRLAKTIYWPPDHTDVDHLMDELMTFVNQSLDTIDPIILAGLFHKQFVIIHPFIDGNGRAVRLATKVLLAHMGLNTFNLFSFENFYNLNVTRYFNEVGVKGNYYDIVKVVDFTSWLEYFSEGILDELLRVQKIMEQHSKSTPDFQLSKDLERLLRHIEAHGYIRDSDYAKLTTRAKATRALDFKKLLQLGKIERQGNGPSTYYIKK